MLTVSEIRTATLLVPQAGGEITAVNENGEVYFSIGFPCGIHPMEVLLPFVEPDYFIEVSDGVVVHYPDRRVELMDFGYMANETGANPDFHPATLSDTEKRMRQMMRDLNKQNKRLEKHLSESQVMLEQQRTAAAIAQASEEDDPDEVSEVLEDEGEAAPKEPEASPEGPKEKVKKDAS